MNKNTEKINMINHEYYDFELFEKITQNIKSHFITALESIIELAKADQEIVCELLNVTSHDLQQLKRLESSIAADLINTNIELLTFNISSEQVHEASSRKEANIDKFIHNEHYAIINKFYQAQMAAILELDQLIKIGGKELANLIYQINGNGFEILTEMRPSCLYETIKNLGVSLLFNQRFSRIPLDDTIMLLSSTARHSTSIRAMLTDSILNAQNHENSQVDFQDKLLAGRPISSLREDICLDSNISQNSALVWAAQRATSTDKFIKNYLASNFIKILKAKINYNKDISLNDKIFLKNSMDSSRKASSFSWASGRLEQLKIYLLVSMYTTVFDNNDFKRYPTLHELVILCYAFELKYNLRNSDTLSLDLSHVHAVISKMPLVHGNYLDKSTPGYEELRQKEEDPQPGFIKAMCLKCSTDFYVIRSSNSQKCVWCIEGLHKKRLRKPIEHLKKEDK